MIKSRIVAIALISIILSSSSFSVVDGNTVWVEVSDIKSSKQDFRNESKFYNINLVDNVRASLTNNKILDPSSYEIKLFDAASIALYDNNDQVDQIKENFQPEIISINLSDGIQTDTTDFSNNDDRIILIKQSNDKKALWERIFPLDRIRNISKSFFKIIQNDYTASYVQLSEISINNDENSLEPAAIYRSELENLSEFEKFVGKSDYVYNQIGIHAFDLLDAEKFVGKANFVGIQLAQHVQRLADPEKFVGKSSYVSDQIAIRVQHLADPEKFVSKSMFVGHQITIQVYQVVDPKNPTLLVLLIPLVGLVLIRNENDRIKFYNIQKLVSLIFAVILISSAVITPFSYSVMYWGYAFAEENSAGNDIGPPEELLVDQLVQSVDDMIEEITEPPPVEEPVLPPEPVPVEEPIQLPTDVPVDEALSEQNNIIPTTNDLTIPFDENLILADDSSNELEQHIETQQTQYNQTISFNETFNLIDIISLNNETQNNLSISLDEIIVLTDAITSPDIPQNQSELLHENLSFLDDIILLLQNQTIVPSIPNATESWQFENDTNNADLIGDATIDNTEGINGTSLLLDGQLDYAQANGTNATTYITDMSIAAWVKPNYTNGSPEFTVVSKGKSFVLSVNNIIEPQHVAKFSVFDGIKWTTVESYSTIPDSSWSHITARFNKTSIALYVNGTLEETVTHGGVPYVTEKGQIALKTLPEITSYYDIVIGASLSPNMESRPYNMFSGMIDGVQLFDSKLEPDDIILLYQTTIPIKSLIPVPEIRSRPEPVLRYRIIKGNETLPISIPVEDLDELNQLTVSMWIKPNFTGGSPEFTVLSRENSFALSLNKMLSPERVAKFSVYDGIMWHTVTGSTPIDGWTQVAAVVNGSRISIYVNGTLDGKLETGPPKIAASTSNVIIGAYENTLRGEGRLSNYYFGEIDEAIVWEYSMIDREMEEEYLRYINQYTNSSTSITTFTLKDAVKSVDFIGISNNTEGKLEVSSEETSDTLRITEELLLNLNGIPIIPLQDSLTFSDNLILTLNQEQETSVNATILPQTLTFSDSLYLKLNGTTYTYLEEGLLITEGILLLLNNQTVSFSNSTSRLTHGTIEIGKPVDWTQTVMLNETDSLQNILVELPADAQNIQIQKTDENGTSTEITEENLSIIEPELEPVENEFDIPRAKDIDLDEIAKEHEVRNVVPLDYATLGNLGEIKQKDRPTIALLINETRINATENLTPQNQTEYTVKFQTPAPYALENDYSIPEKFQKNVTVAHDSALHYTDVKSYTDIPEYLAERGIKFNLHWIINETKVDVTNDTIFQVTFVDTDGNGITDRMEWIVPQLSEQEFKIEGIINITKATHLDENREVIEDVYPQVKERDGIWTQPIPKDHYIRVSFEKNLGAENDISIYAKSNYSNSSVEVYEVDSNILIASFGTIDEDKKYRIFLSNFNGTHHTFDLKIVGNPVEFDFIVDPPVQPHVYVEQTARQTSTSSTYGNIPGAVIRSNKFTPDNTYLLVFTALLDGSDVNESFRIRAAHEGIAFTGSEMVIEPETTTSHYTYSWFTVWKAVAGQNVTLQHNVVSTGTVGTDQVTMFALNLGGQLKENRDWFYSSNAASTTMSTTGVWTTTNNAAVTFTPTVANQDWLVMATGTLDMNFANSNSGDSRLVRSGERSANLEMISWEREDTASSDLFVETLFNVTKLGAASNTFTQQSRIANDAACNAGPGTCTDARTYSSVFALNLGRFANHAFNYDVTEINILNTPDYGSQVLTTSITPNVAGPVWIMSGFISDNGGQPSYSKGRQQVDNVDQPPTQSGDAYQQQTFWDPADELHHHYQTVESLSAAAHTIDLDASEEGAGKGAEDNIIFAVTMDLAPLTGTEKEFPYFTITPDAAAPGMNVNVQIIGENFTSIDKVTTNSSDIVVGPTLVYNTAGNVVTSNGVVLSTTFFIDKTAAPQAVNVTVAGANLTRTFQIINTASKFTGTGDYSTAAPGTYTLGDNKGINGNRTKGGTIVLDSLIVPNGVTLNINVTDKDPSLTGNQGYLPAVILVDGPVIITGTGTITVAGENGDGGDWCIVSHGGDGGPGGGGGGGGGSNEPGTNCGAPNNKAGKGGNGFAGGGGGGGSSAAVNGRGGAGGNGTFALGDASPAGSAGGGDGGHSSVENRIQNGTGSPEGTADGGGGGGGGSGFVFGIGGKGWDGAQPAAGQGGGNGGGADSNDAGGGGGGFGTAGSNGNAGGDGEGTGGTTNGNAHLVPYAGGSGGGGGSADNNAAQPDRHGGAAGGGGGSVIIMSTGNMTITGTITAAGGNGGVADCCGTGDASQSRGSGGGGGSGGGIVLQSANVTVTSGTLRATGGTGGSGGQNAPNGDGGAGGDGRVRVDGIPTGTTIPGAATPGAPTEFVGPAITNITNSKVIGRGAANALIEVWITNGTHFHTSNATVNANSDFTAYTSYFAGTNYITVIQFTSATVGIMSSGATYVAQEVSPLPSFTDISSTIDVGTSPSDTAGRGGAVVFLDANNDGYLDVYFNDDDALDQDDKLILNDKDNTFTDDSGAPLAGQGQGAGAGDFDNDKDVDLIVGEEESVYTNDGTSTWTLTDLADADPEALMFVDIDGDADLDIWAPGGIFMWYRNDGITTTSTALRDVAAHAVRANGGCTNPTDAFGSNDVRASCDGGAVGTPNDEDVSDYYFLTGFGVPAGAPIAGVTVNIEHLHNTCPADQGFWTVQLRNDVGNLIGNEKMGITNCDNTAPDETETFGSSSDIWGATLTSGIVNDADFGVAVNYTAMGGGGGNNGLTDNIQVQVSYLAQTWVGQTALPGLAATNTNGEGASAADVDNDGDLDLIFSRSSTDNEIYIRSATNTYTQETDINGGGGVTGLPDTANGGVADHENMEWAWGDYDNDTALDVYISGADSEGLYRNNGAGAFTQVNVTAGVSIKDPDGAAWGDYDNDGYLDLILSNATETSKLYRNNGDGTFNDTAASAGINHKGDIGKTVGIFDSDNDGDLDIISNNPLNLWRNNLYLNTILSNNANNSFKVFAFGNGTNAGGKIGSPVTPIGAQITIRDSNTNAILGYREIIPSQNQLAPPHQQHFGLNPNKVFNIEILFPSKTTVTLQYCTQTNIPDLYKVKYSGYAVPLAFNVTETSGSKTLFCGVQKSIKDTANVQDTLKKIPADYALKDSAKVDDKIKKNVTKIIKDSVRADDDITRIRMILHDDMATVEDILKKAPADYVLKDSATVNDVLRATALKPLSDTVRADDDITRIRMILHDDMATVEDILKKAPADYVLKDSAKVDDKIKKNVTYRLSDSAKVDDIIKVTYLKTVQDDLATIEDILKKAPADYVLKDSAKVDDKIKKNVTYRLSDSAKVDDIIKVTYLKTVQDDLATIEDILKKAPADYVLKDSAKVDDKIKKNVTYRLSDSAKVDDIIKVTYLKTVQDDLATIEDILKKAPADYVLKDSATVNDVLRATALKPLSDTVRADDDITRIRMILHDDMATVEDILKKAPADYVLKDSATVNDVLRATTTKPLYDSATVNDVLTPLVSHILRDSATVNDVLRSTTIKVLKDAATVNDVLRATTTKPLYDSATVNDVLTPLVSHILRDSATVNDVLRSTTIKVLKDAATVNDVLRARTTKPLYDSATADDDLLVIQGKILRDSATVNDVLRSTTIKVLKDAATVNDVLRARTTKPLYDSATVNDTIGLTLVKDVNLDSATINDSIRTYVTKRIKDSATVNDVLRARTTKPLYDSATVNDTIGLTLVKDVNLDSATINDSIRTYVTKRIKDSATVNDVLRARTTKPLYDSATVNDTIGLTLVKDVNLDSATINDSIRTYVTFRIKDSVIVNDVIRVTSMMKISDSVSVDDAISPIIVRLIHDSASVEDFISFYVTIRISDSVLVNTDNTLATGSLTLDVNDSATINDVISITVTYRPKDSASVDDVIGYMSTRTMSDSVSINEVIKKVAQPPPKTVATVDDRITRKIVTLRINDSVMVEDAVGVLGTRAMTDSASVDDFIRTVSTTKIRDSASVDDYITITAMMTTADSVTVDDVISKRPIIGIRDVVLVDDAMIRINQGKILRDSASVDDVIAITAMMTTADSVTVDDVISKRPAIRIRDTVNVDDFIRLTIIVTLKDSSFVNDVISVRPSMRLHDSATTHDTIAMHVQSQTPKDSAAVDDIITIRIIKNVFDSATADDIIRIRVTQKLTDIVSVDDDIVKIIFKVHTDSVLVDDVLRASVGKHVDSDSATIDDVIRIRVTQKLTDSISVDDDILKIVIIVQIDSVLVDDVIRVRIIKDMKDSATADDIIRMTVTYRPKDSMLVDDFISKMVTMRVQDDLATAEDVLRPITIKPVFDSATADDTIRMTVFYRPKDSISVEDDILKLAFLFPSDAVLIDDVIRVRIIKDMKDSATADDTIRMTVFYRPKDSISVEDDILKLAFLFPSDTVMIDDVIRVRIIKPVFDSATADDIIRMTVTYRPKDSMLVDDFISKMVTMRVQDDLATVDDLITIAPATFRPRDSATVDDTIKKTVTYRPRDAAAVQDIIKTRIIKRINDTASANDLIKWKLTRVVKDTISVNDFIRFYATLSTKDAATADDHITWTLTRSVKDITSVNDIIKTRIIQVVEDSARVDDAIHSMITKTVLDTISIDEIINPMGAINIETRDGNGNLVQLPNTYRIIPDPFTGIGSLVVADGDPNDYDNVPNNGQINIFPVPLDTYRINQTVVPSGYLSLINFTYTTVHYTDINATALFRVILDPADLPVLQQESDILDIANNGFDDIRASIQLVKVNNGTQVIINYTTDMPAPIFAGVNNSTAISNAISSQFTLLYKNLVLPPNDSPEDIISKFRQTPYDAGNFTETTFVGVMAATNQTGFGQYLATQPFDKFNCGQQYIYGIDDTLVPTFGGMTGFDMNMSSAGVCPDVQDYLTFEVAQVPPAGIPKLSGEDTLLYVNPQYPRISTTAAGVDFRDSSNIDSFIFTLISPLPETNSTDGLSVYLQKGAVWSTMGVTILSKQLLSTGPNVGMVEITVSVDHLAKMVVGGKLIPPPPPPPPIPFGQGLIGVGPAGVAGGVPDMPTARIHRVEYDVCNENIVRILATHDSSSPPRIQLLTTKSGVIDATLSSNQPFANQNKFTLVDRYLFEAPLAQGESVFTIFAVDYHSNVQRTLVQVEGCQGVLVFADDQIVLPHIFDFKYRIDNGTYIRADSVDYHYINEGQEPTVSAIVESLIVPLRKAELYISTLGSIGQTILPMSITPLLLPDLENVSVISTMIPANLLKGPAVEFWIRIVTEEGIVQESVHSIVGVKPDGYSDKSSVEMDTVTIKAQGTTLKPTAYLTNEGDTPVYGEVSLVADSKKVYSIPVLLTPGQNIINLEWKIPKIDAVTSYNMQTQLDVYDTSYITGIATLDTFMRTKIVPISDQSAIVPATDELGNVIARPAMMYSSNDGTGQFRVTSPDGTCVIGAGCLVEQSTLKHRGGIDSVLIDGHIYRVRYSGDDSPLERFSITSLDSVLGAWNVKIVDSSPFTAAASDDVPIKVQYRAERSPIVTVGME